MRLATACIAILLLAPLALAQSVAEPSVKKSEQGICHPRGSATYKRTTHFDSFDTMEQCLASGGRVAKNAPGEKESESASWLGKVGGKIALVVGMLVAVGGAFLLSRRSSAASSAGAKIDELERNKWEGNKRE